MVAIAKRHKPLTLLACVILVQVLLLAAQIKRERQVRLIRIWAVEGISPVQRVTSWVLDMLGSGWGGYVGLRHARQENEQLRADLNQLKVRNAELEGRAREADRLAALVNFREGHNDVPMTAARVVGASPDSGSNVVYINRGSRSGIRRDMGVITPDGVVGKIIGVYPDTSQVLLLNDKDSGVGALFASTRTQGVVKGLGEPQLALEYVSNEEKVQVGATLLTSGQDRIFPKDLPLGTVVEATPDKRSPFMHIRVDPAAHLDRLEEVLVLLSRQDLEPKKEAQVNPAAAAGPPTVAKAPANTR